MKISELIKELQSVIDTEGDLEVTWSNTCYSNTLEHISAVFSVEKFCHGTEKCLDITTC